jgi:hypothetical protein
LHAIADPLVPTLVRLPKELAMSSLRFSITRFDNTDGRQTAFECIRVVSSPSVSHFNYRRKR